MVRFCEDCGVALMLLPMRRMIALLVLSGLTAGGFLLGFLAISTAPDGYQDETGFHFGRPEGAAEELPTCQVPQPRPA